MAGFQVFKNGFSKISVGSVGQVPDAAELPPSTKLETQEVIQCGRFRSFRSF